MSWERDALWTKAKLFFEKGFDEDKEEQYFGLWCAMGLELLSRAAISNFSPTLLAEPDRDQQNLLYALGHGSAKSQRRTIGTSQVLLLSKTLIAEFTDENFKAASAIIGRRNEEVHTGSAAFQEYPTQQWLGGFYNCCKILAESQNESLTSLFGEDVAKEADLILTENTAQVLNKTKSSIAAHKKVFDSKEEEEKTKLAEAAKQKGKLLAYRDHHRVKCPSCNSVATVQGEAYGKTQVSNEEDEIIVRQSILPTNFACNACGLKLKGYGALSAAEIADHYTKRTSYRPEEYYDMINPNDHETIADHYEKQNHYYEEYNNE